jgi:anaerobic selenocysteine-containing dehydrogenase
VDRWVQSACVLCSNGCACDIAVKDGRMVGIRGRAGDVVNHGRMGPKGLYGSWQWNGRDRLTRPLVREHGRLVEADWDHAMDLIVRRSRTLLDEIGQLSHGFHTSRQLFLEEYCTLAVLGKPAWAPAHGRPHHATAAACQVNNLHLLRGMIGQPGRGVLQMNGQPTAQNTRECGADGDLPGFRN